MEDTQTDQQPETRRPFHRIVLRFLSWLCSRGHHKWKGKTFKGGTDLALIYWERVCERCGRHEEHWRHGAWQLKGERQLRWGWEAEDRDTAVEVDGNWRPLNEPASESR